MWSYMQPTRWSCVSEKKNEVWTSGLLSTKTTGEDVGGFYHEDNQVSLESERDAVEAFSRAVLLDRTEPRLELIHHTRHNREITLSFLFYVQTEQPKKCS